MRKLLSIGMLAGIACFGLAACSSDEDEGVIDRQTARDEAKEAIDESNAEDEADKLMDEIENDL